MRINMCRIRNKIVNLKCDDALESSFLLHNLMHATMLCYIAHTGFLVCLVLSCIQNSSGFIFLLHNVTKDFQISLPGKAKQHNKISFFLTDSSREPKLCIGHIPPP